MANGVIAAFVVIALCSNVICQSVSVGFQTEEATTFDVIDNLTDVWSFSPTVVATIPDAQILNGSFCRRAYECHAASAPDDSFVTLGCSCHDYCTIFSDCCPDKVSAVPPSEPKRLPLTSFTCAPSYLFQFSVYMITACPASFDDRALAANCTNFTDFAASAMDIRRTPVTDIITGATFRNLYCAMCWRKMRRDIATWLWKLTCPKARDENVFYSMDGNTSLTSSSNKSALSDGMSAANYLRSTCRLTFDPPELNVSLHSCTENAVVDCGETLSAATADEALLSACQNGPAGIVYDNGGIPYRNADCARCNRLLNQEHAGLSCQSPFQGGVPIFPSLSLSIILTPESGDCAATASSLPSNDGWTPEELCQGLRGCRQEASGCQSQPLALCSSSAGFTASACTASAGELLRSCKFTESPRSATMAAKATNAAWLNVSFADGSVTLAVTLSDNATVCFRCSTKKYSHFTVTNRSLVVTSNSSLPFQSYDYPMYVVEDGVATVCTAILPLNQSISASDGGCSAVPAYVSALFLCLSEASLVVFFAAYARVRALRRFPGEMVLNESVAFFLAFLLFLLRPLAGSLPDACTALAVLIHYFLLAAFAWTALYSTEIARALSFRVSEGVSKRRRVMHYGLAWGAPLVCVALGLGADANALQFRPLYGPPQCFIGSRLGNLTLFMAPLCVFLTIDIVVYIFMIVKLVIIARQTKSVRSSHREKLWLSVKLVFSMGILWLFAVLASLTESAALYCTFSLVNALQGVFVSAVFVCKRDVLSALVGRKLRTSSTMPVLLSGSARTTLSTVSS